MSFSWTSLQSNFNTVPMMSNQDLLSELKNAASFYKNLDSHLSSESLGSLESLESDDTLSDTTSDAVSDAVSDTVSSSATEAHDPLIAAAKFVSLYKTEMCASFSATGICPYGSKCKFAHGLRELREIPRHPKYKSTPCRNFLSGSCPYGKRCCFQHSL